MVAADTEPEMIASTERSIIVEAAILVRVGLLCKEWYQRTVTVVGVVYEENRGKE